MLTHRQQARGHTHTWHAECAQKPAERHLRQQRGVDLLHVLLFVLAGNSTTFWREQKQHNNGKTISAANAPTSIQGTAFLLPSPRPEPNCNFDAPTPHTPVLQHQQGRKWTKASSH